MVKESINGYGKRSMHFGGQEKAEGNPGTRGPPDGAYCAALRHRLRWGKLELAGGRREELNLEKAPRQPICIDKRTVNSSIP
jgi:hypothetical protein